VCICFSHIYVNFLKKTNIKQILTAPYFFNTDLKKIDLKLNYKKKSHAFSTFSKIVRLPEYKYLINVYTPLEFKKIYEKAGYFCFPYTIDDPLAPPVEINTNNEYYNYQELIWEIYNEKRTGFQDNIRKFIRDIYFFLTYK
jgi:hypothetical protein